MLRQFLGDIKASPDLCALRAKNVIGKPARVPFFDRCPGELVRDIGQDGRLSLFIFFRHCFVSRRSRATAQAHRECLVII
jgi:hypothetical protein